jgi:hypothetical protein
VFSEKYAPRLSVKWGIDLLALAKLILSVGGGQRLWIIEEDDLFGFGAAFAGNELRLKFLTLKNSHPCLIAHLTP